jgi:hypothetical protein
MNDNRFVQLEVTHSGRTTHKIIAEMSDEKWLEPERHEQLKESLYSMATRHDWTLAGREIGAIGTIPYLPNQRGAPLPADTEAGLRVWEIRPA